ncbi:MAG: ribonuclease VapC [Candidatus Asgardarchaeum sp.]
MIKKLNEKKDEKYPIAILDSSAFFAGFNPNFFDGLVVITDEIFNEIKNSIQKEILEVAILSKKLLIKSPTKKSLITIENIAKKLGEHERLSNADKSLLALALDERKKYDECKVKVYTNDFSMMNILKKLKIPFEPIGQRKIKKILQWKKFCPSCKKLYSSSYTEDVCPVCGTKLKKISV